MVIALYFAIPSSIIVIISVPIYIVMLASHHKYRNKAPFNSPFFKISFHLGIFDHLHLFNDWVIGMLPYLGLRSFMLLYEEEFAKQFSMIWWYSALAQKMGILFLALDRLLSMWFSYNLKSGQVKFLIAANYILPALLTLPQGFCEFSYQEFNGSTGLLISWENPHYQWIYFFCCIFYCGGTSVVCAVSYGLTFYKVYKHTDKTSTAAARRKARTEGKLAVVGFILFFMTFCCGIFCWSLVTFEMSPQVLLFMIGFQQIIFDVYCCINPYLILSCSRPAWVHFKAFLLRKQPEQLENRVSVVSGKARAIAKQRIAMVGMGNSQAPQSRTLSMISGTSNMVPVA